MTKLTREDAKAHLRRLSKLRREVLMLSEYTPKTWWGNFFTTLFAWAVIMFLSWTLCWGLACLLTWDWKSYNPFQVEGLVLHWYLAYAGWLWGDIWRVHWEPETKEEVADVFS